jgi:sugar transferase (PEP-CTERM/EpsH1 system associated)
MKVLLLTHRMPFPPNKGDKIRSFHILNYLAKRHEVYLACLVDDDSDPRFVTEIKTRVRRFVFERIHPRTKKPIALFGLLRSCPITVSYFYSPTLQRQIDDLIDAVEIDAFVCFSSPMAQYLFRSRHASGRVRRAIRVMDLIDVDSRKWRQFAEHSPIWTSWIYRYEAKHLAEYERRIAREFDRVLVVSEQEKGVFPGSSDTPNLQAMSNGVDLEFFRPVPFGVGGTIRPTLVFTGTMNYRPNIEGIKWFVESVLQRVRAAVPDVELLIVGSKPTPEVERLGRMPGVVVTGFVEDIREYLKRASVCIAPLKIARGLQNKVLEAMAMGKAVVCTPQAYEGIRATPGSHLMVADGADAFAATTIDLLLDPAKAEQLGLEARRCIEKGYGWEQNLRVFNSILYEGKLAVKPTEVEVELSEYIGTPHC